MKNTFRLLCIICFVILFAITNSHANDQTIAQDLTIDEFDDSYDGLEIKIGNGVDPVTVVINGEHHFQALTISNQAILSHNDTTTTAIYSLQLTINDNFVIERGGQVVVDGKGYLGAFQADNDSEYGRTINNSNGSRQTSGGSYGGLGGGDYTCPIYGDLKTPTYPGSGGGASNRYQHGGDGGGYIQLKIAGTFVNNGLLSANGLGGIGGAGSGSGGSIYLSANMISGNGTISANGGTGERSGGGGGRIALYYTSKDFTGTIAAYGGAKGIDSEYNGGAGTIFLQAHGQQFGELIIDNNELIPNSNSTSVPSDYTIFDSVVIDNGASVTATGIQEIPVPLILDNKSQLYAASLMSMPMVTIINGSRLTAPLEHLYTMVVNNGGYIHHSDTILTIDSSIALTNNAILTHSETTSSNVYSLKLEINGDLFIDSTSKINADGKGYIGGYQPGNDSNYGRTIGNTITGGSNYTSGGSYGGLGGDQYSCNVYGDYQNPVYPGSGGGSANTYQHGGDGGGYIQLIVLGTMTHNGIISANGLGGVGGAGSGSGGSIYLSVDTLTGSGSIIANGGTGERSGGGGGRIAMYYNASTFSGVLMTDGGKKGIDGFDGQQGTLFLNGVTTLPISSTIESNLYLAPTGKIKIDINGLNQGIHYPFLTITGDVSLGGELFISLSPVFVPSIDDTFDIITAKSVTREFDNIVWPDLPDGRQWLANYSSSVSLQVTNENHPPEIRPDQSFTISEYSSLGTIVGQLQVTDMDNDALSYSIVSGIPALPFTIDTMHGYILVNEKLIVDTAQYYTLTVVVSDTYTSTTDDILIVVNKKSDLYQSDLTIETNEFSQSAVAGEYIVYNIHCLQSGPSDVENVTLTVNAYPQLSLMMISFDQGISWQDTTNVIPLGEMLIHSSTEVFIKGKIDVDYNGSIETEILISSNKEDPYPEDNYLFLYSTSIWPAPTYEITENTVISAMDTSLDGGHIVVGNGTDRVELVISGGHRFASLMIKNNATLTHPSLSDQTRLIIYENMIVEEGGQFNVDAKGYAPGTGPGYGGNYMGGTYGGQGGAKDMSTVPETYGSAIYPADLGSGGGGYGSGGAGGGKIHVEIGNIMTINGILSANGENADSWCGGGAGGSIYIKTYQIDGSGNIYANGGQAGAGGSGNNPGGGGGGRIAIHFNENIFQGNVTAFGGIGIPNGNPGTIGFFDANDQIFISGHSWRFETIDAPQDNNAFYFTKAILTGTENQPVQVQMNWDLSVDIMEMSYASLVISDGINLTAGHFKMISDTSLDAGPSSQLNIANLMTTGHFKINADLSIILDTLTIGSNSIISANHKGFSALKGPGAGIDYGNGCGSGASFGGLGGTKETSSDISIYGSAVNPGSEGSGGGGTNGTGGSGGGMLRLIINNILTINGQLTANGEDATSWRGGGSGGSIYIKTNILGGSGLISANGGNSGPGGSGYNPGGGGGGRIAIYYNENFFSGTISAYGGTGSPSGSPGTVGLFDENDQSFISGHSWHFQASDAPAMGIFSYNQIKLTGENSNNLGLVYVDNNFSTDMLIMENVNIVVSDNISLTALQTQVLTQTYIEASPSANLSFSNLITHSPYEIHANISISVDSLTIGPDDIISANALGYPFAQGPGAGEDYGSGCGTGGSYGGRGGTKDTQFGLPPYGTEYRPLFKGSGGGGYNGLGGAGGGLIELWVSNTLIVDGLLAANGESATSWRGGGSGGGIYIQTNEFKGNGKIQANGGTSGPGGSGSNPGGGGGGRILVEYQTNDYSGNIEATGGIGTPYGDDGSTVVRNLSEADLIVEISDSSPIISGTTIEYSIVIRNEGPGIARQVMLNIELPSWLIVQYKLSTETLWKELLSEIMLGDIEKDTTIIISVRGSIADFASGIFQLSGSINADSPDTNQSNNEFSFDIPVNIMADLSISKACNLTQITNGNELMYTITARNSGPSNAIKVTITDSIPMGLSDVMFSKDAGLTWNEWTGTYTIAYLPKDETIDVLLKGIVQSSYDFSIENTAYISSVIQDLTQTNNVSTVSTTILSPPAFADIRDYTALEDHNARIIFSAYDIDSVPCTMSLDVLFSNNDIISSHTKACDFDTYTITLYPETNRSGALTVDLTVIDMDGLTASESFEVTFISVNDPPSFQLLSNELTVFNTAGQQNISNWAQYINAGASDESTQTLWFNISATNLSLFEMLPELDRNGTLSFKPASDASGQSVIDVFLQDDGGIENSGIDTSEAISFTIIVQESDTPDNQPPSMPAALTPTQNAIVLDSSVQLSGSAFSDPDTADVHMYTYWRVRPYDAPYYCFSQMMSPFCHMSTLSDPSLTDYVVNDIYQGMKYFWQLSYVDEGSGQQSQWSDESSFVVGEKKSDSSVIIEEGRNVEDFCMKSFVMWPENPSAQEVFKHALPSGYDIQRQKIGTYDPISGTYKEFWGMDIQPGRSYWFLSTERLPITIDGVYVSMEQCITIRLLYNPTTENGWNMIGAPNKANYDWYHLTVLVYDDQGEIIFSEYIKNLMPDNEYLSIYLWHWDKGIYDPNVQTIHYNDGYWVEARHQNVYLMFSEDARVDLRKRENKNQLSTARTRSQYGNSPPQPMAGINEVEAGTGGCFIKMIQH